MKVCVGYCVVGMPMVHVDWMHSLMALRGAEDRVCVTGGTTVSARNDLVRRFLETDCDALLMTDVDGTFAPDALELLVAADKPLIGGLAFAGRAYGPVYPTLYGIHRDANGERALFLHEDDYPRGEVIQVHATGAHFLFVHRDVLTAVGHRFAGATAHPWFAETEMLQGGVLRHVGEDVTFCMRAGMVGTATFVHTGVRTGHMKVAELNEGVYDLLMGPVREVEATVDPTLVVPSVGEVPRLESGAAACAYLRGPGAPVTFPERPEYDDRDEENYGLVLPFVCVASVGGPFDDDAFVAGFQLGLVDAKLATGHVAAMTEMLHEALEAQCDLIAMHRGYTMDVLHRTDGWIHVGFTRADAEVPR